MKEVKSHAWFEGFDWAALRRKEMKAPFKPVYEEDPPMEPRDPDEAELNARK
jgi:hypothetical protein